MLARALDGEGILDAERLATIEGELVASERWSELAALYAGAAIRAPEADLGRRMMLSAGLLWLEKLGDGSRAEPFFRRVLASDPESVDALDALRAICLEAGRHEEAADLLERAAALLPDQEQPELWIELAQIAHEKLRQVDRALLALRTAYERDPSRLDVLERARSIFTAEERWADAKQVLEDEARAVLGEEPAAAPPEKVRAIAEAYRQLGVRLLAHAAEHKLAEACLEQARALGDQEALSKLDELAHIKNEWESRAAAFRDEGFEARDKRKAAQLYLRAAELFHEYGKNPIRADEYLDRCLLLSPGYPPALRFIETSHVQQGRLDDLVKKLNGMAQGVKDPAIKVEILLRVAHLLEGAPESPEAHANIVAAYRRALAIQPGHREAVSRAAGILAEEGRHADRAQILEAHLAAITDEYARTESHLELGRLYAEMLGDSARARAHFEAVLVIQPSNFLAASALRALYKDAREQPLLLGVLKVLLDDCPDLFSRLKVLSEMAEVAAEVSREEAFWVHRQIFELDPGATASRAKLEALAEALGRYHALADAYVAAAEKRTGPRAVELYIAAAKIYDGKLPRPSDAIRAYRKALEQDPENTTVHDALERLLRQQDDPAALVEMLKSQLHRNSDPAQEPLLLAKIADVLDRELGDLDGAIQMFNRVLEKVPDHSSALSSLDDLYRKKGQFEAQEQILVRREAFAESPAALSGLQIRRARLLVETLGRKEEGAELYLEVLARAADTEDVVPALTRLLEEGVSAPAIARALEPVYAQRGNYARQLEALRVLVADESDPKKKRDLARRAAQLAEGRLDNLGEAFEFVAIGVAHDPGSEELRDALLRLGAETRQPQRVAEVFGQILNRSELPREVLSQSASSLAELFETQLGNLGSAIDWYQKALSADGANAGAIAALERLLGREQRYEELARLLQDRMARADDKAAKAQLGLALAAIRDKHLNDPAGAVEAYREVLAVEPKEGTALAKLAEVLERENRHRELVSVLDRLRDASSDPEIQAATEAKAGDVLRLFLSDPKESLQRYHRALGLRPDQTQAVKGLESLLEHPELRPKAGELLEPVYAATGRPRDQVLALESQLAGVREPERRRALYGKIAKVEEEGLDQLGGAYETLARAFREGLIDQAGRAELTRVALRANRPKELAQMLEDTEGSSGPDPALSRELAQLYDGAAASPAKAKSAWEKLLTLVPGDREALEALERLTAAGDNPGALGAVLLARAEAAFDSAERVAFYKRAAAIFEEAAEDLPRAILAMERARQEDPRDRSTFQELERYYEAQGQMPKLAEVLQAEALLIEEPLQRAATQVRLAEILTGLNQLSLAIEAYKGALLVLPEHHGARSGLESLLNGKAAPEAALALEPVYRAAGDWAHLVEAYEILAAASADPLERVERLVAIRSIYEERLGKLDRAFQAAARAYKEAPSRPELGEALERLGKMSGSVEELIGILEDQAEAFPFVAPERRLLRAKIADYYETVLRDRARALEAWKKASDEAPEDLQPLLALERLYTKGGEARELVEILKARAVLATEPAARAQLLRQSARVFEEKLGDRTQAARAYEAVLHLSPKDPDALLRLDVIYTETRSYADLGRILLEEIGASEGQTRAHFLLRLGLLRRNALEDPRGALAAFAAVLDSGEGPTQDQALAAIDELIETEKGARPELAAEAASLSEAHWAARGQALKVVAAKEARIVAAKDPEARKALLVEIAQIYEKALEQPDMAFLALTRAYGEFPTDGNLASALERLATIADHEEELAELYGSALPSLPDGELALRLARRTAHIYDTVLERGESAVPFYNRVLAMVPDDASALTALERIHRRTGDAAALVQVYRGMLRLAEGDLGQQKLLWSQIAERMEGDLKDPDGAFEALRAMIQLDPRDLGTLKRMAALCESSGRLDHLAQVLAAEAQLARRPDEKAQVYLRLGTLYRDRLRDPKNAVGAFAAALQARKDDPGAIAGLAAIIKEGGEARAEAAAALAPVYLETGAYEEYIGCLDTQAAASKSPADRRAFFAKIAEVFEERLARPEHAFTYASRAAKEDLADEGARSRLERLARENGLMEDLAAFYLDEVDQVEVHDLAVALRRRVAEIYDHTLKDVNRAIAEYKKILEVAPGDPDSLKALERLYRSAGSPAEQAEVYRRLIAQTEDPEGRVRLMRAFARLQAEDLRDLPGAIATLRRLLEVAPADLDALQRLAKLCEAQGRASELADVLERLIGVAEAGSAAQIDAKVELAKVKATRLGDLGGSDALFVEALAARPQHEVARGFLEERFQDAVAEGHSAIALATGEMLSVAMRQAEEWQELIQVLGMRASLAASPQERAPLNYEIATLYRDRLREPELAFAKLSAAFIDAPGVGQLRQELEQLAKTLLMNEDLIDVLEQGLAAAPDSEVAQEIERRIAQLVEKDLGDKERAVTAWQRVLSRNPNDPEALSALDRLLQALGRWAALVEIIEKRSELAGDEVERRDHYLRLGAIWDERLSEKAEAVGWYRKARTLDPDHKEALSALSLLLDGQEAPDELDDVLARLAAVTKDPRSLVRLLVRRGELLAGPLDNPAAAIGIYEQVLQQDPANQAAPKALDALYDKAGRYGELAELLERQLGLARDEKEVTRLQRRLGLVRGRLGSVDEAVRSFTEILKRNPNDVEALTALRKTYREAGRWEDLAATLKKLIPLQGDAEGVKSIRFELAEIYLSNLKQREEAIESAKRVLDVEPHTPAELMRLEEIFVATAAYGEAVKVMNARVEQAETVGGRIEILFEIAQVYEQRIHRRAGASAAYEKILSLEPTSRKAFDALSAIYEQNGDYKKLVELQNRRLEHTEEAEERRRLLFAIIDVQERWLGSPEMAFTAACRAFAEEGADQGAQALAERLAEETDNWEILASVYEEQVEEVGAGRAVELRLRLGEIYLEKLKDPGQAETQLEHVLSMRPEDERARNLLLGIFEKAGRWSEVIGLLGDRVELSTTAEAKIGLFRQIAKIEEQNLKDVEGAISSLKRVLDLEPENAEALAELSRIFRAAEKWHPLLNVLQRRLELAYDQEEKKRLRFEIAGVWESGVEDPAHAIEAYGDVLALDESFLPALKALERLYTQEERWSELVEVYERQVSLAEDGDEAILILTRIAAIHEEQFRSLADASRTLIRILEINPEHLATVKSLERVWTASGDWANLVDAHLRHIELVKKPEDAVALYLAIGELYQDKLGQEEQAEEAFRQALAANPNSKEALKSLADLHERQGSWFNALEMLSSLAALLGASREAVEVHERIGKINQENLGEVRAAKEAYARALEILPSSTHAIHALRQMSADDGDYGEVITLYAQEAEFTDDNVERASLYQQAAETALDRFDDGEQATRLYEKAKDADSKNVQVLRALSDLYFAEEAWKKSEDVLEKLVERLDRATDQEELCRSYYRLAYIAEKLGEDHTALKRYLESYELDATYLPTLEGLAAALLRVERWEDAQRVFQTILIQHKASLTDAEVVDLHFQIGELSMKLDQLDRAKKSFQKALALDSEHASTLRASAELSERLEEWDDAYDFRERLIRLLDGDEKYAALVDQAKLCQEKKKEPYGAIDAYVEARRLRPHEVSVLKALVMLYGETSQVPRVIEILTELAGVLTEPAERRKIYMQLAAVYSDHQRAPDKAVAALNEALDVDPNHLPAFQHIEQILADTRDWAGLEANYHRMIKRLPKEAKKQKMVLWKSLGDLYHQVLHSEENARVAYEVVLKLEPEAYDVQLQLAQLYAQKRELKPKAVQIYHDLAAKLPAKARGEPARRLFELYFELGQLDRAFCALSALVLMGQATEEEKRAYAGLLAKKAPANPSRALTDTLWQDYVLHPRCRSSLGVILSAMYRGAPQLFELGRTELDLKKKKELVDLTTGSKDPRAKLRYFSVWQQLAAAMHVGEMDHYLRAGTRDAPRMYPGAPAVLFAGDQHAAFQAMPPRLLIWTLARQMAAARPQLAPVRALAPEEVGAAIEGAIQLYSPPGSGIDLGLDKRLVKQWQEVLQRSLPERALKALREGVVACLQNREMRQLPKFLEAAEHSASRAALLFAIDVQSVDRGLGESDQLVAVSLQDRKDALVLYMLSEDYFLLRDKLGLAIPPT